MSFKEIPIQLPELRKLYADIGEAKVRKVIQNFYDVMKNDMLIGFYFDGKDIDGIAAKQTEFVLRAMGAIPSYTGKPPADAHNDLAPILSGHFDRRLKILEAVLLAEGLTTDQARIWIGFENAFRDVIVQK